MRRLDGWIVIAIGLGVACGLAAGVGTARAAPKASAWAAAINAGLLAATFVAILWYSLESQAIRKAMVRQNELAVRPFLVAGLEEVPSGLAVVRHHLVIRNVARGPALFVAIEDIAIGGFIVRFELVDVVRADASEPARPVVYVDGTMSDSSFSFISALLPSSASRNHELTLRYTDVAGGSHFSVMRMGKDGTRLVRHSGMEG